MKVKREVRSPKCERLPESRSGVQAERCRCRAGIMLVECMVYIGALVVVLGLAFMTFYRCQDFSVGLRRNADAISRALNAGEMWRQDIRSATGQIRVESKETEQLLRIPQKHGEVLYRFCDSELRRRSREGGPWTVLLPQVKSSQMQPDVRTRVTAWRWELELIQSRKNARVRPVFTFQAVPMNVSAP
jgi:hypothetical protein